MLACRNGHKDVVQLLLNNSERNIDVNARNQWEETSLMYACRYGYKDVVQLLLDNSEKNIDMNARSNGGRTAFMFACSNGHKDVVQILLDNSDKNIDLNAKDSFWKFCIDDCEPKRTPRYCPIDYSKIKPVDFNEDVYCENSNNYYLEINKLNNQLPFCNLLLFHFFLLRIFFGMEDI